VALAVARSPKAASVRSRDLAIATERTPEEECRGRASAPRSRTEDLLLLLHLLLPLLSRVQQTARGQSVSQSDVRHPIRSERESAASRAAEPRHGICRLPSRRTAERDQARASGTRQTRRGEESGAREEGERANEGGREKTRAGSEPAQLVKRARYRATGRGRKIARSFLAVGSPLRFPRASEARASASGNAESSREDGLARVAAVVVVVVVATSTATRRRARIETADSRVLELPTLFRSLSMNATRRHATRRHATPSHATPRKRNNDTGVAHRAVTEIVQSFAW